LDPISDCKSSATLTTLFSDYEFDIRRADDALPASTELTSICHQGSYIHLTSGGPNVDCYHPSDVPAIPIIDRLKLKIYLDADGNGLPDPGPLK